MVGTIRDEDWHDVTLGVSGRGRSLGSTIVGNGTKSSAAAGGGGGDAAKEDEDEGEGEGEEGREAGKGVLTGRVAASGDEVMIRFDDWLVGGWYSFQESERGSVMEQRSCWSNEVEPPRSSDMGGSVGKVVVAGELLGEPAGLHSMVGSWLQSLNKFRLLRYDEYIEGVGSGRLLSLSRRDGAIRCWVELRSLSEPSLRLDLDSDGFRTALPSSDKLVHLLE